jgi:hypothetical protein
MRRLKAILKWTSICLCLVLAIVFACDALASWRAGADLEARLQAIREAGDPLSLADLAREPLPPEQNAAALLRRADRDLDAIRRELASFADEKGGYLRDGELTDKGAELVEAALAAYPEVVPLLIQAAEAPDYDPQHDFSKAQSDECLNQLLPRLQANRSVARVLKYQANMLRRKGDYDGAMRATLAALRLGRQFAHEPLIVSYLVSLAVRGLAMDEAARILSTGEIATDLRKQLELELERQISMDAAFYRDMLKAERAFGLAKFQELAQDNGGTLSMGRFQIDACNYLDLVASEMDIAGEPHYRIAEKLSERNSTPQAAESLTAAIAPMLQATRSARLRTEVMARCLRVLSALQTHPVPEGQQVPDSAALGLPADFAVDPSDGQPLRIRRLPSGWLIYGVGENQSDDGGSIKFPFRDVGVSTDHAE